MQKVVPSTSRVFLYRREVKVCSEEFRLNILTNLKGGDIVALTFNSSRIKKQIKPGDKAIILARVKMDLPEYGIKRGDFLCFRKTF